MTWGGWRCFRDGHTIVNVVEAGAWAGELASKRQAQNHGTGTVRQVGIMRNGSTGNLLMMVEGPKENVNVYFKLVMWYDVKGQSLGLYVDVLSCGDIYEEVGEWCEQW